MAELRDVFPEPLEMPNSLFSWPTATNTASPVTKPSITGRDRNWLTNPSRATPASAKTAPTTITRAPAVAAYRPASSLATPTATTVLAINAAVADVACTDRWRDDPSKAYTSSEATRVYRPASGGSPAMPA